MGKFYTKFFYIFVLTLVLNFSNLFAERDYNLESKEMLRKNFNPSQNIKFDGILPYKNINNKIAALTWTPFDSLANSLTMMNDKINPISKDPLSGNMALIMRGSHEVTEEGFAKSNSKNNLFLKTSTDDGLTWGNKELIYSNEDFSYGEARYPSIFVLNKGNATTPDIEYLYTYSLVVETTGAWNGFGTGLKGEIGNSSERQETFAQNGNEYKWGRSFTSVTTGQPGWSIADSKITGWFNQTTSTNILCTGPVTPLPTGNINDNSNIAYRLINNDLTEKKQEIPSQWRSQLFTDVTTTDSRTNTIVDVKRTSGGTIYSAVFGSIKNRDEVTGGKNSFAVSTSNDDGNSWSELEIFPWSNIEAYINNLGAGLVASEFSLPYWSNSFVVKENGDYSYFTFLIESSETKLRTEEAYHIVELFKENGQYGVRKVADNTSRTWVPYFDNDGAQAGNGKNYELQVSMTADGENYVAKWVELTGEMWPTDSTFQFQSSDIFFSTRKANSNTWTKKYNITNDEFMDRCVWMPDVLTNDITKIPLFRVQSKGTDDVANQRRYLSSQLIMSSYFDLNEIIIASVDDEIITNENIHIYPNPASSNSILTFNLQNPKQVKVIVYDNLGNEILVPFNDFAKEGINYVNLDVTNITTGAYFVAILIDNKPITTKTLNVIK